VRYARRGVVCDEQVVEEGRHIVEHRLRV
jgi:hypothetical protein